MGAPDPRAFLLTLNLTLWTQTDELRFDLTTSLFSQEPFVQGAELGEVFAKHLT